MNKTRKKANVSGALAVRNSQSIDAKIVQANDSLITCNSGTQIGDTSATDLESAQNSTRVKCPLFFFYRQVKGNLSIDPYYIYIISSPIIKHKYSKN